MTLDHDILKSLGNHDMQDAHELYTHALKAVGLATVFSPAVLRAVSDKLAEEASDHRNEPHEREVLTAISYFLTMEAAER
jgi:hypothetical protein